MKTKHACVTIYRAQASEKAIITFTALWSYANYV